MLESVAVDHFIAENGKILLALRVELRVVVFLGQKFNSTQLTPPKEWFTRGKKLLEAYINPRFLSKTKDILLPVYKSLVRSRLEYCVQALFSQGY